MNLAEKFDYSPDKLPEILRLAEVHSSNRPVVYRNRNKKPFLFCTDKLIIRRFFPEDLEEVQLLSYNRHTSDMKNYDHPWPLDLEGCKSALSWFSSQENIWAVCLTPGYKLIGMITYNSTDDENILDVGHVWHTDYQGQHLDTLALSLMTSYAFETQDISGICAYNPLNCENQLAPLKEMGMEITETKEGSFIEDEEGHPIIFTGCKMILTRAKWEDYFPKAFPVLLDAAKRAAYKSYPDSYVLSLPDLSIMASELPRCPATVQFSSEVSLYLEITGEGLGFVSPDNWRCDIAYTLADALSGNIWAIDSENQENSETRKAVLSVLGYDLTEWHGRTTSYEEMKEIIKSVLYYQQKPVILRYLPEHFFGGIVVGYEKQGDILLGLSFDAFDYNHGIQPKIKKNQDWFQDTTLMYILNKSANRTDLKDCYLTALKKAKESLFQDDILKNQRSYYLWQHTLNLTKEELEDELKNSSEVFSRLNNLSAKERMSPAFPEVLAPIVDPLWCEYAENRYYAAHFMRQAKKYAAEFLANSTAQSATSSYTYTPESLTVLTELFEETARSLDKVNPLAYEYISKVDGIDPINMRKLAEDAVRMEMSDIVIQWEMLEDEVAFQLTKILDILNL